LTKNLLIFLYFTLFFCLIVFADSLPSDNVGTIDSDVPILSRPIFISRGGTYFDYVTVAFRVAEPDITIRYTMDGSPPDENSAIYTAPFQIKIDATVMARAYKPGLIPSEPITQDFILQNVPQVVTVGYYEDYLSIAWHPIKSIVNYEWVQNNMEDIEKIAPTKPINVYAKRLVIAGNMVNQRLAVNDPDHYILNSNIKYDVYLAKVDGEHTPPDKAHFQKMTERAIPDTTFSIQISEAGFYQTYIQAVCELILETNLTNSSQIYTTEVKQVENVTITPMPGLYYDTTRVHLSCPNAKIYFTLDGSTPDITSRLYTAPILLNKHTVTDIKYRAYSDGFLPSDVYTSQYRITDTVTLPHFSHPSGLYHQPFYLTLYCDVDNSLIFYTTDGSEPSRNSQIYVNPLLIDRTMTIKAEGTLHHWKRSGVLTAEYEIMSSSQLANPLATYETRLLKAQQHPTEPRTNISFILKNETHVEVMIYNLLEQKVVTLISSILKRGEHIISWDGKNSYGEQVASGVYFCYFKTSDYFEVMKIVYSGL